MDFNGISQQAVSGVMTADTAPMHGLVSSEMTSSGLMHSGNGFHSEEAYQQPQGEYLEWKHVVVDGGDHFWPTATCFDLSEELLWMGNTGGHVTSYYSTDLQKYTSFQMHENTTCEVRQLLSLGDNIMGLFTDSLRCWSKYGRRNYVHTFSSVLDAQCMLETSDTRLLIGGHQPILAEIDLKTQQQLRQTDIQAANATIMKRAPQFICTGDTTGKVSLRDPSSLKSEHELQAHSGTLSDIDVNGNQLYTCGFANRMGALHVDRYLMIYDLRTLRPLPPMQVNLDPMFMRYMPNFNKICLVSQSGQFQVTDIGALTPESMIMYQVHTEGAPVVCFDASQTYNALAFGDSHGFLHLFTKGEGITFNQFSKETIFPHYEPAHPPIRLTDVHTPYSAVPMVYPPTGVRLSSDWPTELCSTVYRKPLKIDPEILRSCKLVHNVGYAPNPGTRRRNQCMYKLDGESVATYSEWKLVPDSPLGRGEDPWVSSIPKQYSKVEIKYSKLGVEDFDFRHYNKTNFAGLETHIPNAYCNSMLQVLYFTEPLRCALISHLCRKEFCLSCELGFLFHMLDLQKGKTCQASNFLRAFRTIPEASALGLVLSDHEESVGKVNLPRLIQNWGRFIMQQVHSELVDAEKSKDCPQSPFEVLRSPPFPAPALRQDSNPLSPTSEDPTTGGAPPPPWKDLSGHGGPVPVAGVGQPEIGRRERKISDTQGATPVPESPEVEQNRKGYEAEQNESMVTDLYGCELENIFQCRCGNVQSRTMTSSILDLNYQEGSPREKAQIIPAYTLSQIIQRSLLQEQQTQAWCPKCEKYQPHTQTRVIKTLPKVLVLNCHLESVRDFEFWRAQEEYARASEASAVAAGGAGAVSAISYSARTSLKMCRYGKGCTRKDCKFRHEGDFASEKQEGVDGSSGELPRRGWVPYYLKLTLTPEGKVTVSDVRNEEEVCPEGDPEPGVEFYELLATVAHIDDHRTCGNLIANVKVSESFHRRKEGVTCHQWYLFNDFSIAPIEKHEAVHFSLDWKVPCVVFFNRVNINKDSNTVSNPITDECLLRNKSMVGTPRRGSMTFTSLADDEIISLSGAIVGLDAEFVTLNQEEAELRSDGTQSTLKPSQLSVARVSCVRGWGDVLSGEPFIDDYISTQEQVVDYLTQFSGIKPGDLDASVSSKHLTTLKAAYMKLRYLVDSGAIFVGHGLKKDFRVINLVVPKEQIIDTVELFHLPRQRMISLRFLAWHFLGLRIQVSSHDSVEDARTALLLYRKHSELQSAGPDSARQALRQLYERGRALKWKIPPEQGTETTESDLKTAESGPSTEPTRADPTAEKDEGDLTEIM